MICIDNSEVVEELVIFGLLAADFVLSLSLSLLLSFWFVNTRYSFVAHQLYFILCYDERKLQSCSLHMDAFILLAVQNHLLLNLLAFATMSHNKFSRLIPQSTENGENTQTKITDAQR